jgi:uncharacterized protein YndB with AHSA1/START domain
MIEMAKKEEIQIEFELQCSPRILFNYLHTPSGLSEWFADDVTFTEGVYTFKWTESESHAKIVHKRDNKLVRFKWLDEGDEGFFEFEIVTDDLTSDVALVITDFAAPDDMDEVTMLWEAQIHELKQIIGA